MQRQAIEYCSRWALFGLALSACNAGPGARERASGLSESFELSSLSQGLEEADTELALALGGLEAAQARACEVLVEGAGGVVGVVARGDVQLESAQRGERLALALAAGADTAFAQRPAHLVVAAGGEAPSIASVGCYDRLGEPLALGAVSFGLVAGEPVGLAAGEPLGLAVGDSQ